MPTSKGPTPPPRRLPRRRPRLAAASAGVGLRLRSGPTGARRLTCKTARPSASNGLFVRTELEANWPVNDAARPARRRPRRRTCATRSQPFVLDRAACDRSGKSSTCERESARADPVRPRSLRARDRFRSRHGRTGAPRTFQEIELEVLDDLAEQRATRQRPARTAAAGVLGARQAEPRGIAARSSSASQPRNAARRRGRRTTPIGRAILDRLLTARLDDDAPRTKSGCARTDDPEHLHQMRVSDPAHAQPRCARFANFGQATSRQATAGPPGRAPVASSARCATST